ncbi:DEAD/DEAH box helicase domain protein [Aliarcobacter butzleri 7h1h]|uniref:DEAD/DEAH box helicase n=1 Tax=Aliarcobacter butzleri TaxID=28197 RepID=UPI00035B9B4B|nr:DEAD/DEAH box helicase [Aliarcobacter butzleri]AGR77176.1 DEAD/DEAH box helicase domain protein [Aliarcobacter butzleri 7h1h]
MHKKFDINMNLLRNDILENVYSGKDISEAELNLTDLSIYSRNNTLFSKLSNAVKRSLLDDNITLTNQQVECLNILEESNLFLSAPTSFGKTFIALEFIARNHILLKNIIFVVPTISLMNELRRKCFNLFNDEFIIITSESELDQYNHVAKKIMIVVPERISTKRFKEYINSNNIDFLVYDEIYKLNYEPSARDTNDRIIRMNYIYKYLINKSRKILLLGPFIRSVSFDKSNIKIEQFITNLNLVYNNIEKQPVKTIDNLEFLKDKQFVYFNSPNSIKKFLDKNELNTGEEQYKYDDDIVQWISENIHPEWYYSIYLKKGIGIHHGKTPLFLRKYIEYEYANTDGCIHTILCTSTLMEGINTPTNKLIIYDPPRGTFELNNLIGRVGRLNPQNPQMGIVQIFDEKTFELYNPEQWIDLKILYEVDDIETNSPEDEILYLDKFSKDGEAEKKIDILKENLDSRFGIKMEEVIESEIEVSLLNKFIDIYDEITSYEKEWNVINDIKFKLLRNDNSYINGLLTASYSFDSEDEYIFDAVYALMINGGKLKPVITKFVNKYTPNVTDINNFIDLLFQIDEFIKFKMMKMVGIYELFNSKNLFDKSKNRAFIQSIHMIESYCDSVDGYERILTDLGIPQEDIVLISNEISKYNDINGTEKKLKKLIGIDLFNNLSPFSKKIIAGL